jgi:hypothetical protein
VLLVLELLLVLGLLGLETGLRVALQLLARQLILQLEVPDPWGSTSIGSSR